MSELNTLARPYANAVFQQALGDDQLKGWSEVLRVLSMAASDPLMRSVISNPAYQQADIIAIFSTLLDAMPECQGDFQQAVIRWLNLLFEAGRLLVLPQIESLFLELFNQHKGIKKAELQSARPLSTEEVSQIQRSIEHRFQTKVIMDLVVNEELTGGIKVRIGSLVWNGSIQNSIAQLGDSLRG